MVRAVSNGSKGGCMGFSIIAYIKHSNSFYLDTLYLELYSPNKHIGTSKYHLNKYGYSLDFSIINKSLFIIKLN